MFYYILNIKMNVTIIIKIHRATHLRLEALYKSLTMIVSFKRQVSRSVNFDNDCDRHFYVQNVIEHRYSWNNV